ncbi:phage tail assembly chaperone [Mesorhizobium sp. CA13]|uniref:phage tail assembly chaperone n=1 Tax=Mesorhizobium sp. CA13 TaxID=2876643 RepID=UPI001CC918DD|nr:phage tail assembly chaperone [Mesorhizobium sp. CA13]
MAKILHHGHCRASGKGRRPWEGTTPGKRAKPLTVRGFVELWQQVATGPLGWSPATFWRSTLAELVIALEGKFPNSKPRPLTGEESAALEAQFRAKQMKGRKHHGAS